MRRGFGAPNLIKLRAFRVQFANGPNKINAIDSACAMENHREMTKKVRFERETKKNYQLFEKIYLLQSLSKK